MKVKYVCKSGLPSFENIDADYFLGLFFPFFVSKFFLDSDGRAVPKCAKLITCMMAMTFDLCCRGNQRVGKMNGLDLRI